MENLAEVTASDVAPESHPAPAIGREQLRLALAMRGGVSLAVWIGGAVSEIERLRRAGMTDRPALSPTPDRHPHTTYGNLLKLAGYSSVTVDVLAGASAGGLNAAVYAAAQCHGFDVAELRNVWLCLGDIETSSRGTTSGRRAADHRANGACERDALRPPSLLDGDAYFYTTLRDRLEELIGRAGPRAEAVEQIDLLLSATLYKPQDIGVQINRLTRVQDAGSEALFRFRRGPAGDDLAARSPQSVARLAKRLAMAARASSSFPVAFEPARIHMSGEKEPTFDGIFEPPGWPTPTEAKDGFEVMDGGVLDNIPITAAIRAIVDAPAEGPTDRWLLYLHPSPSARPEPDTGNDVRAAERLGTPRAIVTTTRFLAARLGQESALADMRELQAVNDTTRRRQLATASIFSGFLKGEGEILPRLEAAWRYRQAELDEIWIRLDTKVVVGALARPANGEISWTDVGAGAVSNGRLPWPDWSEDDQLALPRELHHALLTDPERSEPWRSPVWLGELVRILICWASAEGRRTAETAGARRGTAGNPKAAAYRLRAVLAALERAQIRHWVRAAWSREPASSMADWVTRTRQSAPRYLSGLAATRLRDVLARPADSSDPDARAELEAALQGLASPRAEGEVEIARMVWNAAREVAAELRKGSPEPRIPNGEAGLPAILEHLPPDDLEAGLHYAVSLSAPVALLGPAPEREIRFAVLSGEAHTPLDEKFAALRQGRKDDQGQDLPPTARLRPSDKLCGDDLGNFAAFLSSRWRLNDWMWGRLDAAATLVDNLLDPERLKSLGTSDRAEFLRTARAAITDNLPKDWNLDDEWHDVEGPLRDALDHENWDSVAEVLRKPVVTRLQLIALAEELPVLHSLDDATDRRDRKLRDGPPPKGWEAPDTFMSHQAVREKVAEHEIGRLTMADLDDHRRVRILLRATLVAFGAVRPAGRGIVAELGRWGLSLVKPLVLIAAFVATSLRRGLFVGAVALATMQATYWHADETTLQPVRQSGVLLLLAVAAAAGSLVPKKQDDEEGEGGCEKVAAEDTTRRVPRPGLALLAVALLLGAGLTALWSTGGHFALSSLAGLGLALVTLRQWWRGRSGASPWDHAMYAVTVLLVGAGLALGYQGELDDPRRFGSSDTNFALPFLILTAGAVVVSATGTFWMAGWYRWAVGVLVIGVYTGAAAPFVEDGWPEWAARGTRLAAGATVAALAWSVVADRWARTNPGKNPLRALPGLLVVSGLAGAATWQSAHARTAWSNSTWITLAVVATSYALTILATYAEVLTPRPYRDGEAEPVPAEAPAGAERPATGELATT